MMCPSISQGGCTPCVNVGWEQRHYLRYHQFMDAPRA